LDLGDRPLLCLITNRRGFRLAGVGQTDWEQQLEAIHAAARAGCQLIQIREKDLGGRELTLLTRAAIAIARPFGARILVNDRLDVALASGADGVHLRTTSLGTAEIRQTLARLGRPELLIGVSTHSLAEARRAESAGADFIVTGPVYPTPSKIGYGPPMGLERLAVICREVRLPVIGLGGIGPDNFQAVMAAGAAGVAGIALFQNPAPDSMGVEAVIRRLREARGSVE